MTKLEADLLEAGVAQGKKRKFVQFATAAGQEGDDRLGYWRELGAQQARRIGVEVDFIPVFNRDDAMRPEFADRVSDVALIYFSGGDPHHLADSMRDTPLWSAIEENYTSGGSLAGCSAGAMFLSTLVPSLRFMRREPVVGMGLTPNIQVIPHYDKIGKWIPDAAVRLVTSIPEGVTLVGIDEETALLRDQNRWHVWGHQRVHVINGPLEGAYEAGAEIPI